MILSVVHFQVTEQERLIYKYRYIIQDRPQWQTFESDTIICGDLKMKNQQLVGKMASQKKQNLVEEEGR